MILSHVWCSSAEWLSCYSLYYIPLADHYKRPSLGLAGSLFWVWSSVTGMKWLYCEKACLHCVGFFSPFASSTDGCMCAKGQVYANMLLFFFFSQWLDVLDVPSSYRMMHYAWNIPKPSFKNFFKTVFCITANSSGRSREAVKGQTVFQRYREKVVFSTAPISCPRSDL